LFFFGAQKKSSGKHQLPGRFFKRLIPAGCAVYSNEAFERYGAAVRAGIKKNITLALQPQQGIHKGCLIFPFHGNTAFRFWYARRGECHFCQLFKSNVLAVSAGKRIEDFDEKERGCFHKLTLRKYTKISIP